MQNFDEKYFYHQNVQIWNPRASNLLPTAHFTFKKHGAGDSVIAQICPSTTNRHRKSPQTWRTTLYWNPSFKTNADGKAQLSFFCADASTTYHAQLEGLSFTGTLGKATANLQVK